jgi:NADH-quinone oxidoreductase subunit F
MKNIIDKCCTVCTNTVDTPCKDFVDCRNSGPICHSNKECEKDLSSRIRNLKREDVAVPNIFIGTGTCGLGAGAGKTLQT